MYGLVASSSPGPPLTVTAPLPKIPSRPSWTSCAAALKWNRANSGSPLLLKNSPLEIATDSSRTNSPSVALTVSSWTSSLEGSSAGSAARFVGRAFDARCHQGDSGTADAAVQQSASDRTSVDRPPTIRARPTPSIRDGRPFLAPRASQMQPVILVVSPGRMVGALERVV